MIPYIIIILILGFNIFLCCHFILNSVLKSNYNYVLPIDKNNSNDEL